MLEKFFHVARLVGCAVFLCARAGDAAGWETVPCEPVCTGRHEAAMTACAQRGGSPDTNSVEKIIWPQAETK